MAGDIERQEADFSPMTNLPGPKGLHAFLAAIALLLLGAMSAEALLWKRHFVAELKAEGGAIVRALSIPGLHGTVIQGIATGGPSDDLLESGVWIGRTWRLGQDQERFFIGHDSADGSEWVTTGPYLGIGDYGGPEDSFELWWNFDEKEWRFID